jgi:tRNA 2-thiocytidine biosynthesis protein TtcA
LKTGLKKRIDHAVGKAIHEWGMIQEKDRILVGVSGGRDSQVLINLLFALKKKAPVNFDLMPVYIDAGFENSFATALDAYIQAAYGALQVEYTNYGTLAHSAENTENPCFLCARLRRKRLFEIARDQGYQKIALGHNKDDIIETLFINMFYAGKMGTMEPRQSFFGRTLDVIRPLAYVEKQDITRYGRLLDLPEFENTCPSAHKTKRSEIRHMLETLYQHNKHIKGNIFRSMHNIAADYLLDAKQ